MVLDIKELKRKFFSEPTRVNLFGDISQVSEDQIAQPLDSLSGEAPASLAQMIESIIAWGEKELGTSAFAKAQAKFQDITGRFFHDDPFYNQRISYFLDCFLFEQTITFEDNQRTPYDIFINSAFFASSAIHPLNKERFHQLSTHIHSLFYVKRIRRHSLIVRDLLSGKTFSLEPDSGISLLGFHSGMTIQGFTFKIDSTNLLSSGTLVHGKPLKQTIRRIIRDLNKKNDSALSELILPTLANKNLRLQRHKHLDARTVYRG